ncbi:hypothetical protein [Mycobacterium vicinigordonae]|nr:hypothetical protein [Mycobacterium vicinigordonae]
MASTVILGAGAAGATGAIPINAVLRNCDFSQVQTALEVPHSNMGHGTAQITSTGSSVTAHVNLLVAGEPGHHFDVGLIQEPMPSSATCGPGAPGTTFTGVDTDASGQVDVTLQAPIRQGTTGVWIMIESGNPHNNAPAEFYTTEFLAPV